MPIMRIGRAGLAVGLLTLLAGALVAGGSALIAGDWWLAREPWIDIGLTLLVVGLALTAVFGAVLDVIEPVGWLRLLAVPPALVVGLLWADWLVIGLSSTGFDDHAEHDVRTIIYSVPYLLVVVLAATLLICLPLVVARLARSSVTSAR